MEERINIAELLKNCPRGMELDSPMFEGLEFDSIVDNDYFSIRCRIKHPDGGYNYNFTKYGCWTNAPFSKCIIFPKGKTTWEGFHRPFKNGDIIADSYFKTICIFKGEGNIKGTVDFYCGIDNDNELFIKDVKDQDEHFGEFDGYNFATEEEKQKLFEAIKENGYKWNSDTKTLEKLIIPKFKVGNRIKEKNSNEDIVLITDITDDYYIVETKYGMEVTISMSIQNKYELVPDKFDINTLKPYDKVLVRETGSVMIFH